MHKIKLFCFPYAGGSALIFNKWKEYADPAIEIVPIELAGRGRRLDEQLYKNATEAVEDAFHLIKDDIQRSPYALFGHSMGSLIAHRLAQKIRENHLRHPLHAFFSGRGAPHVKDPDDKIFHLMNETEFKKEIIAFGGTPPEFFEHPELMKLFLPLLKNDFRIVETEEPDKEIHPLDNDITIFFGKEDDQTDAQCVGWKKHTKGVCHIHYFNGGHFFLHDHAGQMVKLINHILVKEHKEPSSQSPASRAVSGTF